MNLIGYNNFINYKTAFSGMDKGKPVVQKKDEKFDFIAGKVLEVAKRRVGNEVPENGKFTMVRVFFDVPETQNEAYIGFEHDEKNPKDVRRISLGVRRNGSDRVTSTYIFKGNKKEVLDFVNDKDNKEKIIKITNQLSESVDKYYQELQ